MTDNGPLSEILVIREEFSRFDEVIALYERQAPLLQYDTIKIEKMTKDIEKYLKKADECIGVVENIECEVEELGFYFEGKEAVESLATGIGKVDKVISAFLEIVEGQQHRFKDIEGTLVRLEEITDLLLEIKKRILYLQKNINLAVNYVELTSNIMLSLQKEICECEDTIASLLRDEYADSLRQLPKLRLEEITAKMKISHAVPTGVPLNSITLPTFDTTEEAFYSEYTELESRISPLKVSLDYLPWKIEEFNFYCASSTLTGAPKNAKKYVLKYYESLKIKWAKFVEALVSLKAGTIDRRWHDVFKYLIEEIIEKCGYLINELTLERGRRIRITEEASTSYKLCSNSITLIARAFAESVIYDPILKSNYNENLLSKWNTLNTILKSSFSKLLTTSPSTKSVSECHVHDFRLGLRLNSLATSSGRVSRSISCNQEDKIGLDLGLGVKSASLPFSIKKKDRVIDIFQDNDVHQFPKLRTVSRALLNASTEIEEPYAYSREENEKILQNSKTFSDMNGPDSLAAKFEEIKLNNRDDEDRFWNSMPTDKTVLPSKIPVICKDYIIKGYPIIKKKFYPNCKPTKIPTISPDHPVFNDSPEIKRCSSKRKELHYSHRRMPLSPIRTNIQFEEQDIFFKQTPRKDHLLKASGMQKGVQGRHLLRDHDIPNLSYNKNSIYRSTSPDRPATSVGSRFDEKHLIQPLKLPRSHWK